MNMPKPTQFLLIVFALLLLAAPNARAQSLVRPCYVKVNEPCQPIGPSSSFHLIAANTNNSTLIKGSAGWVWSLQLGGIGAAPAYVKLYDKATVPTCGTDVPVKTFIIPAASTAANGGGSNISLTVGENFLLGIGLCVVTGIADNDNTAVAAATFIVNIDYK